jgi:hypothetical protein
MMMMMLLLMLKKQRTQQCTHTHTHVNTHTHVTHTYFKNRVSFSGETRRDKRQRQVEKWRDDDDDRVYSWYVWMGQSECD